MQSKFKVLLFISSIAVLFAFGNFIVDDGIGDLPKLSSEDLTKFLHGGESKDWKADSFALIGLINTQQCRLDDRITIKSDGTFSYDGGKKLCGREDNQRFRNGTWSVESNGQKIVFEFKRGRRKKRTERHEAKVVKAGEGWIVLKGKYRNINLRGIYAEL